MKASRIDPISKHIINIYDKSIKEPNSALHCLFDIREMIQTHHGGAQQTRKKLKINKKDWARLGQICNDEPFEQGRHKGKHVEHLRNASFQELQEAYDIAEKIINSHFEYVLSKSG